MSVDSSEVRRDLEEILERDLLGPWGGDDEELAGEGPRARYLVGFLAPRGIRVAPEDVDTGLGDMDDEEPGPERATPAAANTMFPRSMGLSFQVPAATATISVTVAWGRYIRDASETLTTDAGTPLQVWRRHQVSHRVSLPMIEGSQQLEAPPWEEQPDVNLRMLCRTRGERVVVELSMVNDQVEPPKNRDSAWLFQTRIEVKAEDDTEVVFLPGDWEASSNLADEDRRLALLYRNALEFGVGRNVAVAWEGDRAARRAKRIWTEWLPVYDIPQTIARSPADEPRLAGLELDMRRLAALNAGELHAALISLADGYEGWLADQESRLEQDASLASYREAGHAAIGDGRLLATRIRSGVDLLMNDALALEAFRFANDAMALQRLSTEVAVARRANRDLSYTQAVAAVDAPHRRSWRPFQLAFVLVNLPALTDPLHPERSPAFDGVVDLLFFPTGGGKTEAYLGLAAYTFAIRRLQGMHGEGGEARDGNDGVAVLMRYTLRLLTAQQFQRAAALVSACEYLRRQEVEGGDDRLGATPFRIGLWVGLAASPNSYDDAAAQIRAARGKGWSGGNRVLQLLSCPWCGTELDEGRDLEPQDQERRIYLYCSDPDGECPFSRRQSAEGLPILTVDEEIYRLMPALVIGTVDKLAQLPWRGQAGMIFGIANRRCSRHGFRHPDLDSITKCTDQHRKTDRLDAAATSEVVQPRPPDLIIQDELHLISGALGTMVGLYETMVDELCSWDLDGRRVAPKIISSTATVRRAGEQVRQLFGRKLSVFPPPVIDVGDTFFSHQVEVSEENPGRRYRGICAHGIRLKQAEIRIASTLLTATQFLFDQHGAAADPYYTLVAYFSALRELAGMRRLLDDDIAIRVRRGVSKGLASRGVPLEVQELTSRMASGRIAETLRQLEEPASPAIDSSAARQQRPRPERNGRAPIAALLATNMLQVGVDVSRLGLMVVTGQPKNTAEYIQATSRVGRDAQRPGLVLTLYNWARPRDLAHFETFGHYHETLYRRVEPLSVTPFAARAVDRGLTGVLVGLVRHRRLQFSSNLAAQTADLKSPVVDDIVKAIVARSAQVTASGSVEARVADAIQDRLDKWLQRRAHIEAARLGYRASTDVEGLLREPGDLDWDVWTAAYSLRETEPEANLVLPRDSVVDRTIHAGPDWTYQGDAPDDSEIEETTADAALTAPAEVVE